MWKGLRPSLDPVGDSGRFSALRGFWRRPRAESSSLGHYLDSPRGRAWPRDSTKLSTLRIGAQEQKLWPNSLTPSPTPGVATTSPLTELDVPRDGAGSGEYPKLRSLGSGDMPKLPNSMAKSQTPSLTPGVSLPSGIWSFHFFPNAFSHPTHFKGCCSSLTSGNSAVLRFLGC